MKSAIDSGISNYIILSKTNFLMYLGDMKLFLSKYAEAFGAFMGVLGLVNM